ncbi:hypothetical protein [Natronolimnobius baerhuensis]|uniref:Rpa-associated protein n=1 Tax=Natronolimnobius baerhuensis TaxID=253108 RepID=A0A202EBS6_9EURY|nr:hypothetical protein [Natronolimnobius baerhuensis]OVE85682.1 hypothetical protein B2G88_02360 [Natronolimnobius baerhuensis]
MSATDEDEVIPGREVAYRLFAAEYDDASVSHTESDEERAPNYVIAPTGARVNRLFAVGTLTEITAVNDEMLRARVVDPTGAFVVYAGQYQPDELATLESLEPPAFVAVTGKARTFQPDDSDQVYTSIRPESIATVDADTRDRWVVSAAEQTLERIGTYAAAANVDAGGEELSDALLEADVEPGLAAGIPLAQDAYGTTPSYLAALRDCAEEAVEVVAGERDQVGSFTAQPEQSAPDYDAATFDSLSALSSLDLKALEAAVPDEPSDAASIETSAETESVGTESIDDSSVAGTATGSTESTAEPVDIDAESELEESESATADASDDLESEAETPSESAPDSESEPDVEPASDSGPEAEPASEPEPESDPDAAETESDLESESASSAATAETDETTATFDEAEAAADADDDLGDFDAGDTGMYEMDDDEREQLEEQFGAEFTTGSEVEEPGEAGIDVEVDAEPDEPAADDAAAGEPVDTAADGADDIADADDDIGVPPESGLEASESDESDADSESAEASTTEDETADDGDDADDDEPAEDVDLQDYVIDTMSDLDDGDGADRSELVDTVASEISVSEDEVEDAIQDALMGGQCYEPNGDSLKPI